MQTRKSPSQFQERVARVRRSLDFSRVAHELERKIRPDAVAALKDAQFLGSAPSDWAALAAIALEKKRPVRKMWEKTWAANTGMTWKQLTNFPGRLRGVAEELERVKRSPFFSPVSCAKQAMLNEPRLKEEQLREIINMVSGLPIVLRLQALGLEDCLRHCPRWAKEFFPMSPPALALLRLSESVKLLTGSYRDEEVTKLLNAAALALDKEGQFDALTIAQARARWKKKPRT